MSLRARPPTDDDIQALARSEEVAAMLSTPGTAVLILDPERSVLWASPNCSKVLGHSADALAGESAWACLVAPTDLPHARELSVNFTARGDANVWGRYKTAAGKFQWLNLEIRHHEPYLVIACRKEYDAALQHWHGEARAPLWHMTATASATRTAEHRATA